MRFFYELFIQFKKITCLLFIIFKLMNQTNFLNKKYNKAPVSPSQSSLNLTNTQKIFEPLTAPCQAHNPEIYTNYCSNMKCLQPLCPDCIESHVQQHKRTQLFPEIESIKNSRIKCIKKLSKLTQMFTNQLNNIDPPKNVDKLFNETLIKLNQIKQYMIHTIQNHFSNLEESIKNKVSQSALVLKQLDNIHARMRKILQQLLHLDQILHSNSNSTTSTIRKVFSLDGNGLTESFMNELETFTANRKKSEVDIIFDEGRFKQLLNECIKFDRTKPNPKLNESSRQIFLNTSKVQQKQRQQQLLNLSKVESLNIKDYSKLSKFYLHFFESRSKKLHLIDIPSLSKEVINLKMSFNIPEFHRSILLSNGDIIMTGGSFVIEQSDQLIKNKKISKYDIEKKIFNQNFGIGIERSSHSLCEYEGYVYIIGGIGKEGMERIMQKVNIKTGQLEKQTPSKFGGPNSSVAVNNQIIKLSEDGIQIYSITKKIWTMVHVQNYMFFESSCALDINDRQIFVFGGYSKQQPESGKGVNTTFVIDIKDRDNIYMKHVDRFQLIKAEGFWNNIPIIFRKQIYALQNVESLQSSDCLEDQRQIIKFTGSQWQILN